MGPAQAKGRGEAEASPRPRGEQARPAWTLADVLSAARLPLAVAFVLVPAREARFLILLVAGASDLVDGWVARRLGPSRLGAFIDPVVDKLFMLAAVLVVAASGRLHWYEVAGLLLRDAVATLAFLVVTVRGRPASIPARPGGKAVTLAQLATIAAFLFDSELLRPLAWATTAIALYAIWDYYRAAPAQRRPLG
jgi:CDP-diacylglycerol--glycerol-3-phosphate 3-phosphatidyltransferase/cardiolipin synthase